MDDILESDRCRMNVETYNLAIIKSTLKARKWTASTLSIDHPLRSSCLASYKTYQLHLKEKKAKEQEMKEKRMSEAIRIRSAAVANRIVCQARKSKGPAKDCPKQHSSSSGQPRFFPLFYGQAKTSSASPSTSSASTSEKRKSSDDSKPAKKRKK